MIAVIDLYGDKGIVRSDGCSCCSATYNINSEHDRERILEHLADQKDVLDKVLKRMKLTYEDIDKINRKKKREAKKNGTT